jgi:heat shock protein HslJ
MPDDQESDTSQSDEGTGPGEQKGYMVSVAVILIAILVVLVVFMNMSGQNATAATTITEHFWSLKSFENPDATSTPVLNGTIITAAFSFDGKLTGSGGCNQYSARYMVKDTLIVNSAIIPTSTTCSGEGIMAQESRYFSLMENATALRVHNRDLTLYGSDGKPILAFTAAQPS